jgi:hypothetical protein
MAKSVKNSRTVVYIVGSILILLSLIRCVEPFSPPEIVSAKRYLVVDGFLNANSTEGSQIKLSRTQNVSDKTAPKAELRAKVTVEGDRGSNFTFAETPNGMYTLTPKAYKDSEKYRVRVKTTDGKEYLSAYVPIVKTPPIDSVTYKINPSESGVEVFVNTHDPNAATRFYRWSFDETWQYYSALYSGFEVVNKAIELRREDISTCWANAKPSKIVLGSSVKLTKDIIQDQQVTSIPAISGKLRVKYSILVKQFGLTQEEYEYWTTLSKTTEGTGGLFDPQPSQVTGNITCINDPSQLVFGYFSASYQREQRIFVTERLGSRVPCETTDTLTAREVLESIDLIVEEYYPEGSAIPDYVMGTTNCADCRLQGGVNKRPPFWQ